MIQAYCYWHAYSARGELVCTRGIVSEEPIPCPYPSSDDAAGECLDCNLKPRMGAHYAIYRKTIRSSDT